jgi:hypothetical protein
MGVHLRKKKIANGKSKLNEENRKNSNKISKKNIKKSLKKLCNLATLQL